MIISTKQFQEVCSLILSATDTNELATITDTLELVTEGKMLLLNVTNQEYYVSQKFQLDHEEEFHATVNATLFLKLIDKITTETIELKIVDNYVSVKGNGNYKIPMRYFNQESTIVDLPKIPLVNKTVEMNISYDILESILNYNSKELATSSLAFAVQKMYYLDQEGCITFNTGACVNYFNLEKPLKVLLNNRLVKLFKLFKNVPTIKFELAYDPVAENSNIVQTKIALVSDNLILTAITGCDDTLLNKVPVTAIRARANKEYDNSVVLNTKDLNDAINRLLLFSDSKANIKPFSTFEFDTTGTLTIYDVNSENCEKLRYQPGSSITGEYQMRMDLIDFKRILETCSEQFITLNFGDHNACVLTRKAIKNVIPEVSGN